MWPAQTIPSREPRLGGAIHGHHRGSYFPSFLEPRRPAEQALVAVVQKAFVIELVGPPAFAAVDASGERGHGAKRPTVRHGQSSVPALRL